MPGRSRSLSRRASVVQGFRRTEGIAPHPAVAYRILEAEEKEQAKRAKVTPRASTQCTGIAPPAVGMDAENMKKISRQQPAASSQQ